MIRRSFMGGMFGGLLGFLGFPKKKESIGWVVVSDDKFYSYFSCGWKYFLHYHDGKAVDKHVGYYANCNCDCREVSVNEYINYLVEKFGDRVVGSVRQG